MSNGFIGQVEIGSEQHLIGSTFYGECSTGASDGAKKVILQSDALFTGTPKGITIHVKFTNANTVTDNTLTMAIKTGGEGNNTTYSAAYAIENYNGAKTWKANSVISFTLVSTGTDAYKWVINSSGIDASSTDLTLGNIQSDGTLQTSDVKIANGDKLVITDASNDNKIARSSLAFTAAIANGSQTQSTTFLRSDGTWAAPSYTTDTHHEAHLIVGNASTDTANEAVTASTTGIYLNLIENNEVRNSHAIAGAGGITIGSDSSGKITFTGKAGTVTSIGATANGGLVTNTGNAITGSGTLGIASGGVTNDMLAGSIAITKLTASTIAIGTQTKSLGQSFDIPKLVTDLGLSSAMKYKGGVASLPTATNSTTFSTYNAGDVVTITGTTNQGKEYVYNKGETAEDSSWIELGDESSYKVKQDVVTSPSVPSSGTNSATAFIDTITQDANGVITATKKNVKFPVTSVATLTGAITATNLKAQLSLDSVSNDASLNSATGSKGDLIYWSDTNTPARLSATGVTTGYVLTLDGGVPQWKVNKATDENVKQTPDSTSTDSFPILFSNTKTNISSATTTTAKVNNSVYIVPKTGEIHASKFYGNGANIEGITTSHIAGVANSGTQFLRQDGWKTLSIPIIASVTNGVLTITNVALSVT